MKRFILGLLLLTAAPTLYADIVSTFDSDLEGWTGVNASVLEWRDTDGNPAGMLYFDNTEAQVGYIFAPAKFLGDLSPYLGGTIAFDGKMLGTGGTVWDSPGFDYGHVSIVSGTAIATRDLLPGDVPSTSVWGTFSAPLVAAEWGKSETEFAGILSNVTQIVISVEALFGNEIQGVDNVRLSTVPLPPGMILLGSGLVGLAGAIKRRI
jgi:hypothetical protein